MNLYRFIQNAGKRKRFSDHAEDNDQKHQKGRDQHERVNEEVEPMMLVHILEDVYVILQKSHHV